MSKESTYGLPDKSALVLYNTHAGDARKEPQFYARTALLEARLEDAGIRVKHIDTRDKEEALALTAEGVQNGTGIILVKGGDDTLSSIAHQASIDNNGTQIATLGGGTENVFRKTISKSRDPYILGTTAIFNGEVVTTDIGVLEADGVTYPFLGNASIGIGAEVIALWEAREKGRHHKRRSHMVPIFNRQKKIFTPMDLRLTDAVYDDVILLEGVMDLPVINAGPYAKNLLTESDPTDGFLDGVVLDTTQQGWLSLASLIVRSHTTGYIPPDGHELLIDRMQIEEINDNPLSMQHDGEPVTFKEGEGVTSATIYTLPGALKLRRGRSRHGRI